MINEVERKVYSGVWTALELLISRGSKNSVWQKNDFQSKSATVRRRQKVQKLLTPILDNIQMQQENETSFKLSTHSISQQNSCTASNHLIMINASKAKKKKEAQEVRLPLIDCSIILHRVNSQVEHLMGSNVVNLMDRKYMMKLSQRIHDDFNNMLMKRIENREADEMQRQRVLLMEGKLTKCPKELQNHPVCTLNEAKNNYTVKRRIKLKTNRERVSEHLLRLVKKWEAEHIMYVEEERKREAEMKIKELEVLTLDKPKVDKEMTMARRASSHCESEMDMEHFLKNENERMLNRLKLHVKQFKPFEKDLRIVDAKRRMSEASIPKMKLMIASLTKNLIETTVQSKNDSSDEDRTTDYDTDNNNDIKTNEMQKEYKTLNRAYVNPMIAELKQTNNVKEMYALAEKIVGNNIDKYLNNASKSTVTNEEIAAPQ